MGKLQKKLFGSWGSNSASHGRVLTPSSDLSAGHLTPSPQPGHPVEIAGQPISPASSSIRSTESLLSVSQPFELQRSTSTLVPELAFSNGWRSPPLDNNRQYPRTMAGNYTRGHQDSSFGSQGYMQAGYPQQNVNGQNMTPVSSQKELPINSNDMNVPHFASEEEFSRDQELQLRRLENRFGPQQQQQQQQEQAIVKRKPVALQEPETQETPGTHPSTSAFNLSINGKPLLESMSSFSTTQQIFVLVFVLTLTSVMFFAVLTSVFSFLRESTMYILAAFALGLGGYGFLNWSRMKGQEELAKVKAQIVMEHSKTLRTEMERDKEMMKQLQWETGASGSGYRRDVKRLENFDTQRAVHGRGKRTNLGFSKMEIEEVE